MDRRDFLKNTAAAASAFLPQAVSADSRREIVLENSSLAWRIESASSSTFQSTAFENRLTGNRHALTGAEEFALVLRDGPRVEIPWWSFKLSEDENVPAENDTLQWKPVRNLAGGQSGRVYDGAGWFRCRFSLPQDAKRSSIGLVLGGYDQQDWSERWVYVNGVPCGHTTNSGRWRKPGVYTLQPGDPAHDSLRFGSSGQNWLQVRCKHYDFRFKDLAPMVVDRYVFHPFLFDQYISIGSPVMRLADFELAEVRQESPAEAVVLFRHPREKLSVEATYRLDGATRRKWLDISNQGTAARELLDVSLDRFHIPGVLSEGGQGEPVFLRKEGFFAVEHPAGLNMAENNSLELWHCPGCKIEPGQAKRSLTSVVAAAGPAGELAQFHQYLQARSPRTAKKQISIYTSYGINNQWGGCGTLDDREVLDCQRVVGGWRQKGAPLDFFTLDTGWPQNDGDLTEFVSTCFPEGPDEVVRGIHALGMKFGIWFSVSWGGWANGSDPAIQTSAIPDPGESTDPPHEPPVAIYRNGYPVSGGVGRQMCIASDPFFQTFDRAVQHHIVHNGARLIKFDSGNYYCNSTSHGHLPGKYSTEAMYNHLIALAAHARKTQPDVFVTWYWGAGSPFWALHGDIIAESGLFMEGSGTSWVPTLYYRDAVTICLDQNTAFAKLIPPMNKDSLGIWLSQIRWANFMGRDRWREALVMDLGRGNLVFPQLWGDPNLLNEEDVQFLARMIAFSRQHQAILLQPRRAVGDPWRNDCYGYTFFQNNRGLVFLHNAHFAARKVTVAWPAPGPIVSHFPEHAAVVPDAADSQAFTLWMRPFETLLLEIGPGAVSRPGTERRIDGESAAGMGSPLRLAGSTRAPWMNLTFADAPRLEAAGMRPDVQSYATRLPALQEGRSILAVVVSLASADGAEYRHKPVVVEIVQLRARLRGRIVQMVPNPDARHFGNTQSAGCSWVVYKVPLPQTASGAPLEFAVHTYLPSGVQANVKAWVTHQWWAEYARPEADGYYGDAPS